MPEQTPPDKVLLPARKVLDRYSVSDVTLWRWIHAGTFPRPDRIIRGRRYWWNTTVDAFDQEAA